MPDQRAPLAAIFLCGSTLEGILLGIASSRPKEFNQSSVSPKDSLGKVKQFQDWTLNDFIKVARDLDLVGEDVKKFSHALRDSETTYIRTSRWRRILTLMITRRNLLAGLTSSYLAVVEICYTRSCSLSSLPSLAHKSNQIGSGDP